MVPHPSVKIRGSESGQLYLFSSLATETKYRFHALPNRVEIHVDLTSSSTPPGRQRRRIESIRTELVKRASEDVPKPPHSSFLDGLKYPGDIIAVSADCLI
ncbi:unnamed protein product [Schistocephalus solidus]|uniref:MSP domain-containing protein n=1 Tax=Schistocephalus solidus TaxID=70667 RepID=A0A183TQH3_SCHSO|nr:unnamed protein product [Schistocephalus solidus]